MNDAVKPVSVLLVEDSDEDVFFFRRAMSKYGEPADVTLVGDGKAAVAFLADPEKRKTIDVVFLDLKLPLMNGFEVLKWIRGHVTPNSFPVYILSGSPQAKDKERAEELGAAGYLVKPVTHHILRQILPTAVLA